MPLPPTSPPVAHGLVDRLRQANRAALNVPGASIAERVMLAVRAALAPRRRIAVGPAFPNQYQVILKLASLNGYQLVAPSHPRPDLGLHFTSNELGPHLCTMPSTLPVINRECVDISKAHVASVFEQTFGYGLTVDPTMHEAQIVEKSDSNATHDGRILDGPLSPDDIREGYVYQRLVQNVEGDPKSRIAVDYRTPLYAGRPVFVYVKRRSAGERFSNANATVEVRETTDVFTSEEIDRLAVFAKRMGLDYGEVDVLRDRENDRLYIVDVANTPAGPPSGLSQVAARAAIDALADALEDVVRIVVTKPVRRTTAKPTK